MPDENNLQENSAVNNPVPTDNGLPDQNQTVPTQQVQPDGELLSQTVVQEQPAQPVLTVDDPKMMADKVMKKWFYILLLCKLPSLVLLVLVGPIPLTLVYLFVATYYIISIRYAVTFKNWKYVLKPILISIIFGVVDIALIILLFSGMN